MPRGAFLRVHLALQGKRWALTCTVCAAKQRGKSGLAPYSGRYETPACARKLARLTRAAVNPSPFQSRLRITETPPFASVWELSRGAGWAGPQGPCGKSRNRGIAVPLYTSSRVKLPRPSLSTAFTGAAAKVEAFMTIGGHACMTSVSARRRVKADARL